MKGIYFVWGLLPVCLCLLVLWALYKKALRLQGREYPKDYLREAIYTGLILFVAIAFDKTAYDSLIELIFSDEDTIMIVRWMIYPAFLCLAAVLYDFVGKRSEPKTKTKPRVNAGKPANF